MEKIKKIIQIGSHDGSVWHTDGQVAVIFEDPAIAPVTFDVNEGYKVYEEYARQNNLSGNLTEIIEQMDDDTLEIVNSSNRNELISALSEVREAQINAMNLSREHEAGGYSGVENKGEDDSKIGTPRNDNNKKGKLDDESSEENKGKKDSDDEIENGTDVINAKVKKKSSLFSRIATGSLAAASLIGAGAVALKMIKERNVNNDSTLDNDTNIDINEFEKLLNQMANDDPRKVVWQTAMDLVTTFNEQTHKDSNFRLDTDGSTYLDLSDGEAIILATFANYSDPVDLYRIFGDFDITASEAQDLFESARTKVITYYTNAKEPSGIAKIFKKGEDRAFFAGIEKDILNFNKQHTTEASDQVIRDVYYNYILDGAANNATVSPMAKVLAFDAVGGMNLVESVSEEHTKFLKFHGNGSDAETKYYIENVLHKDYSSMSSDEIDTYRRNIIEKGTKLLDSSNSSTDKDANLTELVNLMGLCNVNNEQIVRSIESLNTMATVNEGSIRDQFIVINNAIATSLRSAGYDDLAERVAQSINFELSDELLQDIRSRSSKADDIVTDYEVKADRITGRDRPSMVDIFKAAQTVLSKLPNYNPDDTNIATLVNNRLHFELKLEKTDSTKSSHKDDSSRQQEGLLGYDENDIPIYDSSVLDGKTKEEIDQFIIDNGEIIAEGDTETIEEVPYEDLTPEEKVEAKKQMSQEEVKFIQDNAYANGQVLANQNFNSFGHNISGIVYDRADATGQTWYDLSSMSLADAISHSVAYGNGTPGVNTSQFENAALVAAESYANGISSSDQEALNEVMGSGWRETIKNAFINGYMSQIQNEINSAIEVGYQMRALSEQAIRENEAAGDNFTGSGFGTFGQGNGTFSGSYGNDFNNGYYDPNLGEQFGNGEQLVSGNSGEENNNNNGVLTSDDFISGQGHEDENGNYYDDPNLGEQFGEDEQLVYTGSDEDFNLGYGDEQQSTITYTNGEPVQVVEPIVTPIAEENPVRENTKFYGVVSEEKGPITRIDDEVTPLPTPVEPVYETQGVVQDDYDASINDALAGISGSEVTDYDTGMGAKIR